MTFGRRLTSLRNAKGWSQVRLADKSGVSNASISKYEAGEILPNLTTVACLAYAFDIHPWDMIEGVDFEEKVCCD